MYRAMLATAVTAMLLTFSATAASQSRYVTFDPPGATFTYPESINQAGQIAGGYGNSTGGHSFLRNTDGSIISFDPGPSFSTATGINTSGEITGYYNDSTGGYHGYYRSVTGGITTFEVASAGQAETFAQGINDGGAIVGYGSDGSFQHGFIRDPSGTITLFDPPASTATFAESINQFGFISGAYYDSAGVLHGFMRDQVGNFTIVDVPGASGQGTLDAFINDRGQVSGTYSDSKHLYHGYLRSSSGTYTTFDAPGAFVTIGGATNDSSEIVGYDEKKSGLNVGFLRAVSGSITIFEVPGAGLGGSDLQGTKPFAINSNGAITGYYYDINKIPHGFLRFQSKFH